MKGTIVVRIWLDDYEKFREIIPAYEGETACAYFHRVSRIIEGWK